LLVSAHATINSLLAASAERAPADIAIEAPDRPPLAFAALAAQVAAASAALREHGVSRADTVALILPNGPEAATGFLSVAGAATCAPLNPAYGTDELEFYLEDLAAAALVISSELDSPARDVARRRGIPVIELTPVAGAAAGIFLLDGELPGAPAPTAPVPEDIALVLHTSGTTSRPKLVPLTHANLSASARHIGGTLRLAPGDRCLNVMPLFHIHGLMAATISSLAAGASVVCTPGFLAPRFFDWMRVTRPTWYTAVPTMHQAILARAADAAGVIAATPLRFIRSSSAALPRQTLAELERTFGAPVIEAYGMTEAAHQMASNPLPPGERKPGSVGRAAGPEVAIMDPAGAILPAGATGEVVIRGPDVTPGYLRNPAANASAFTGGWFRTGDQGHLDEDGYLYLTGRLKEIINRGGEKVAPLEVDDALMSHPAVAQAVTFAVPHPTLGEEVAAAVVLRPDATATVGEIREAVASRLAWFKVPRQVLFLDALPKGPTGKPQRIGLAGRLGVTASEASPPPATLSPPATPVEEILASIWADVLGREPGGVEEDFFGAGGDSMLAMQFVVRIDRLLGVELPLLDFFDAPTVRGLAGAVGARLAGAA
jgi:acyl-CoA synthetase (AMP-forming)/AMP-acid ligase II/acyl carrier protein